MNAQIAESPEPRRTVPGPTAAPLTEMQSACLAVLTKYRVTKGGWYTADVACYIGRQPGHESTRGHCALIGGALRSLEALGLVRSLRDESPMKWVLAEMRQAA